MGLTWTQFSLEKLERVQDTILARATRQCEIDGDAVRFERIKTIIGRDEEQEVMHSVECERVQNPSPKGPIVMLHGYGAGSLLFTNNMARLAQRTGRKIIAVDWIGCAGSGRPSWTAENEHETISWFLDAFTHWIKARDLEKFDIIGHSLGGYLSSHFLLQQEHKRVDRLVLASPVGLPEVPEEKADRPMLIRLGMWLWERGVSPNHLVRGAGPLGRRLVENFVERRFESRTLGLKGLQEDDPESRELIVEYLFQINCAPPSGEHALSAILLPGAFAKIPLREELPKIRNCEVMIVFGDKDWMCRDIHAAKDAVSKMEGGRLHVIKGNHHVYLDEEFDDLVISFLET